MPDLEVRVVLPYFLRLAPDEYETGGTDRLWVDAPILAEGAPPRTPVRTSFAHDDIPDQDEIQRQKTRDIDQLLVRVNRLLRWYRAVSGRSEIAELTRALASPFEFVAPDFAHEAWAQAIRYEEAGPAPLALTDHELTNRVRDGVANGTEPDVAELLLIDAERAIQRGRFRETVLFCWSTIDTVFNRKYDALLNAALVGELGSAREFFTGVDFGLKNKMTGALLLVANVSLFRQPGDFWQRLVVSYNKRNAIIHRGDTASEDEGREAIEVARRVVEIMRAIAEPAAPAAG
jgi:hypothetical protein